MATPDVERPLLGKTVPQAKAESRTPTPFQGYMLMTLAAFSQAIRAFLFHLAETRLNFNPGTGIICSGTVMLLISSFFMHRNDLFRKLPRSGKSLVFLEARGFTAALSIYLNNVALARLPAGTVLTIFATIPAITSVLAAMFLGDALTTNDLVVLVVNFAGVALVSQPSADVPKDSALIGLMAVLLSAVSASSGFIFVKLAGRGIHVMQHILSIALNALMIGAVAGMIEPSIVSALWTNQVATGVGLVAATFGAMLYILVNMAVQICRPGPALVVRALNVPLSFALGVVFLKEGMSLSVLLGVLLVLSSVSYTGVGQWLREKHGASG